ncbi:MAG: phosphoribosylglycinamide formyltransferase [Paenibacillaceae bacterium ZCTH02-B3]|nr:MAG: phosphoribosylglycinamide formyltransferase [Paenibacillaceae bacterium ZCTH02-B3]
MAKLQVAVFASGNGSNFQALVDAEREGRLGAEIRLLVCNRPEAPVVKRAEAAGIPAFVFRPKDYPSREAYEKEILAELTRLDIGLIVLAGFMRILTSVIVDAYAGRIINIHPALLPAFPGLNVIREALEYGVKVTGVTVHFADGNLDAGPIIAQEAVKIEEDDTEETLAERIHKVEHRLLPEVVRKIAEGRVRVEGRRVYVR